MNFSDNEKYDRCDTLTVELREGHHDAEHGFYTNEI